VNIIGCTFAALLIASYASAGSDGTEPLTRIELWCVGDDGLTQRFRDALERAIKNNNEFTLAFGHEPRSSTTMVVTIEDHLSWRPVRTRAEVSYKIKFEDSKGKKLGNSAGSCWEDKLSICVERAMGDLKRIVKEMR
jgi:hypothetical protein